MKKRYIIFVFLIIVLIIVFLKNISCFDIASLDGERVIDTHISIIGDYLFYESKTGWVNKAINLKNGKKKMIGICLYNVDVYGDEIYYFAQRTPNPESHFRKRNIKSLIEQKVTSSMATTYEFYNNFLYFQKCSYSTDADGNENGYIYRADLDTGQTETVIELRTQNFDIVNDTLYYSRHSDQGYEQYSKVLCDGIFGYSLTDKTDLRVVEGWIEDFSICGNDIVYSEYIPKNNDNDLDGKYRLVWLSLDSYQTTELSKNIKNFRMYNENICYVENESPDVINIYNCSTDNKCSVVAKDIDSTYGYVLHKNKIYYYDEKHNLCNIVMVN